MVDLGALSQLAAGSRGDRDAPRHRSGAGRGLSGERRCRRLRCRRDAISNAQSPSTDRSCMSTMPAPRKQIDRGLNSVMNYTYAYTVYPDQMRTRPADAAQRGIVPVGHGRRAARLHPQPALPGAGQCAPAHRPSAGRRGLRRARPGRARQGDRRIPAVRRHCAPSSAASTARQPLLADPVRERRDGGQRGPGWPFLHGIPDQHRRRQHRGLREHLAAHRVAEGASPRFRRRGKHRGGLGQEIEVEVVSPEPLRLSLLSDRQNIRRRVCSAAPRALSVEITLATARGRTRNRAAPSSPATGSSCGSAAAAATASPASAIPIPCDGT